MSSTNLPAQMRNCAVQIMAPAPMYVTVVGDKEATGLLYHLMATVAVLNPICVVDATMTFDPYLIGKITRRKSTHAYLAAQKNIMVSRVPHAEQQVNILNHLPPTNDSVFVLGGLALFHDETRRFQQRKYLFNRFIQTLTRLSTNRHVIVGVKPHEQNQQKPWKTLFYRASRVIEMHPIQQNVWYHQSGLFEQQQPSRGKNA